MNYKQLVTPNLDPFIYVNGSPLNDWLGWCMGYVSSAFQIFGAASAHIGWTMSQSPHTDTNFPSGVYIPIWFDWWGNIDGTGVKNWGHVAIYKDGQVWSSPLTHKPTADVYPSFDAFVTAFANAGVRITYVGWSEDLLGTKLIAQGDTMTLVTKDDLESMAGAYFGTMPAQADYDNWVGKDLEDMRQQFEVDQRRQNYFKSIQQAFAALNTQLPALQAQVDALGKTVAIKDGAIKDLQAQVAVQGSDTTNLNAFGTALKWFIVRLGLTK